MTKLTIQAGKFKGQRLNSPPSHQTRPTQSIVKNSVFNTCQMWINGVNFLDICAGSGAMGFEALSRGASQVTFIEKNRQACQTIKENAEKLNCVDNVKVLNGDFHVLLPKLEKQFSIIYIDPPYINCTPTSIETVISLSIPYLLADGYLFIEGPKQLMFKHPHIIIDKIKTFGDTLLFICKKSDY